MKSPEDPKDFDMDGRIGKAAVPGRGQKRTLPGFEVGPREVEQPNLGVAITKPLMLFPKGS